MKPEEIITDQQMNHSFEGTNFGDVSRRDVINYGLLKIACGYAEGHTATCILRELGLISSQPPKRELTAKGKEYLYECFGDKPTVERVAMEEAIKFCSWFSKTYNTANFTEHEIAEEMNHYYKEYKRSLEK